MMNLLIGEHADLTCCVAVDYKHIYFEQTNLECDFYHIRSLAPTTSPTPQRKAKKKNEKNIYMY